MTFSQYFEFCFLLTIPQGLYKKIPGFLQGRTYFNPQSRLSFDLENLHCRPSPCWFQSTKPRGLRPFNRGEHRRQPGYFNPRSHKGFDIIEVIVHFLIKNFNPRSHKGFDDGEADFSKVYYVFQSTKPQGLRQQI